LGAAPADAGAGALADGGGFGDSLKRAVEAQAAPAAGGGRLADAALSSAIPGTVPGFVPVPGAATPPAPTQTLAEASPLEPGAEDAPTLAASPGAAPMSKIDADDTHSKEAAPAEAVMPAIPLLAWPPPPPSPPMMSGFPSLSPSQAEPARAPLDTSSPIEASAMALARAMPDPVPSMARAASAFAAPAPVPSPAGALPADGRAAPPPPREAEAATIALALSPQAATGLVPPATAVVPLATALVPQAAAAASGAAQAPSAQPALVEQAILAAAGPQTAPTGGAARGQASAERLVRGAASRVETGPAPASLAIPQPELPEAPGAAPAPVLPASRPAAVTAEASHHPERAMAEALHPPDPVIAAPSTLAGASAREAPRAPAASPGRQVLPMAIAMLISPGVAPTLSVMLDPAELGRLEIRVGRDAGGTSLRLIADRPETMALLARDRGELQQGLSQSGITLNGDGIRFEMAGAAQPDQQGGGQQGQPHRQRQHLGEAAAALPGMPPPTAPQSLLDMRV